MEKKNCTVCGHSRGSHSTQGCMHRELNKKDDCQCPVRYMDKDMFK